MNTVGFSTKLAGGRLPPFHLAAGDHLSLYGPTAPGRAPWGTGKWSQRTKDPIKQQRRGVRVSGQELCVFLGFIEHGVEPSRQQARVLLQETLVTTGLSPCLTLCFRPGRAPPRARVPAASFSSCTGRSAPASLPGRSSRRFLERCPLLLIPRLPAPSGCSHHTPASAFRSVLSGDNEDWNTRPPGGFLSPSRSKCGVLWPASAQATRPACVAPSMKDAAGTGTLGAPQGGGVGRSSSPRGRWP